jgi:Fe-Mn family superoxide dismutase
MPYALPPLPYPVDALEPFYDKATLEVHHGKHHAAYVTKLNDALTSHPELGDKTPEELMARLEAVPADVRTAVNQNGGGHANHRFFWRVLAPKNDGAPSVSLDQAINEAFGSFTVFKEKFTQSATALFGSGWTWLSVDASGKLDLSNTANQDSPLSRGSRPILTLDLWEHAYYLKFQNRRPEWIASWWNIVNWNEVNKFYERAAARTGLKEIYGP